jgi:ATP-dependent helicase STH1/SNF2
MKMIEKKIKKEEYSSLGDLKKDIQHFAKMQRHTMKMAA